MELYTIDKMLRVLLNIKRMPVGEGWTTATELMRWGNVSHSTTYRYLAKMEKLGLVESKSYQCRKVNCKAYRITDKGKAQLVTYSVSFVNLP